MERRLSLVLDEACNISLTLEHMDSKELDKLISKKFTSSDEVRKQYASKIESYLRSHQSFLDRVYNDTGKKYNGSIVITEVQNDLTVERKKVLYKKHMTIFKEITKNKKFMLALEKRDYINYRSALQNNKPYSRIFLEYYATELRFRCTSDSKFNRVTGQWRNAIKESYYYYDYIRVVLKEYKNRYKELGLDSPDVIYSKYLAEKQASNTAKELNEEIESLSRIQSGDQFERDLLLHIDDYKDDNPRFKSHADEDQYPGDLEPFGMDYINHEEMEKVISLNDDLLPDIDNVEEIPRFKTHADEDGYPGDLEPFGMGYNNDVEGDVNKETSKTKTKTLNNGNHILFDEER